MTQEQLKEMFMAQEAWDVNEANKTLTEHFVKLQENMIYLQQAVADLHRQMGLVKAASDK